MERDLGVTIKVRTDVMMWHTVLCVDHDKQPCAVAVTNDPLSHAHLAQVVMHKSRSHACAMQVARYVRRTFDIEEPVTTNRLNRAREAMIGYACTATAQHPPTEATPGWGVFQHIAATPISVLLKEVAGGHNAARTRYVVYEVRSTGHQPRRGITHVFTALERRFREAPPDKWPDAQIVQVGRFATREEAEKVRAGFTAAGDWMWTRKPDPKYVRQVLKLEVTNDRGYTDIVWVCDGSLAVRPYATPSVVIGPHVYTEFQIRHVLQHGVWPPDGRSIAGMQLKYGASQ